MYTVHRLEIFDKSCAKHLSFDERRIVNLFERMLIYNPHQGKPLRYPFFREKKIGGKRIYYLIYDEFKIVLLVAVSTKKTQDETIQRITELLPEYKRFVELMRRGDNGRA